MIQNPVSSSRDMSRRFQFDEKYLEVPIRRMTPSFTACPVGGMVASPQVHRPGERRNNNCGDNNPAEEDLLAPVAIDLGSLHTDLQQPAERRDHLEQRLRESSRRVVVAVPPSARRCIGGDGRIISGASV